MSETTPTPVALLVYDCDAPQRVSFDTERRGKTFKVIHVIDGISDEDIIEFERGLDVRLSDADSQDTNDASALAMSSKTLEPALKLWDKRATGVEKYALRNVEGDWKQEIAPRDKAFAVTGVLLALQFKSLPVASDDEACPPDDDDTSTYYARAIFNGQIVELRHVLRRATPEQMSEFQGVMNRVYMVEGTRFGETDQRIPSRSKALGVLYDKLKVEVSGYAGRVRLDHKRAVVMRHMRAQHKADTGNS
jgi:hypothetical protein